MFDTDAARQVDTARMAPTGRISTDDAPAPAEPSSTRPRHYGLAVVLAVVLVSIGYLVGLRSPWSAHHPSLVDGFAERVPANTPTGSFVDRDGQHRVEFRLDDVVWKAEGNTDSGSVPPCLQNPGERVSVQVGLIEVRRPFGSGSYLQVLSVTCPQ
jgi:hypothetical protein